MSINLTGAGPKGRAIIERDLKSLSPSYIREYALVVDTAQGSEVWDTDGKRYIDFMGGVAVMNVGHRHPHVVEAVKNQIDKFWHICLTDFFYEVAVDFSEKLQSTAPMSGQTLTYLTNCGTEAVESALKLAMYKTKRNQFIGFRGAFHGRTLGALSFTASKVTQRANYHLGLPVTHIPFPDAYRPILHQQPTDENYGETVINYLKDEIFRTTLDPNGVAAILVEPIQGEGGYIVPTPGFMAELRTICDDYGIMMIVDEVQSGAGRTGKWWAIEHEDVEPDVVCFAKGIGSGMPIGGIIAKEEHMVWGPGTHGTTYGGNPVTCASALATMEVIENENLLERATTEGAWLMNQLRALQEKHPSIGDIRGRGLMIGIEFVHDRKTKKRAKKVRNGLNQIAFENGLLLLPCGVSSMRLTPPLNIPRSLMEEGLKIFSESLTKAEAKYL